MTKRMLIDASHPEETRVVVMDGNRLEEFDLETAHRRPLKGNIYLAKVVRVEPSLQAAFVEYGGNRHGFLAFSEIHPDYYQIPVADRQRLLEMQAAEAREEAEAEEEELRAEEGRADSAAATASAPDHHRPRRGRPAAAEAPDPSSVDPGDDEATAALTAAEATAAAAMEGDSSIAAAPAATPDADTSVQVGEGVGPEALAGMPTDESAEPHGAAPAAAEALPATPPEPSAATPSEDAGAAPSAEAAAPAAPPMEASGQESGEEATGDAPPKPGQAMPMTRAVERISGAAPSADGENGGAADGAEDHIPPAGTIETVTLEGAAATDPAATATPGEDSASAALAPEAEALMTAQEAAELFPAATPETGPQVEAGDRLADPRDDEAAEAREPRGDDEGDSAEARAPQEDSDGDAVEDQPPPPETIGGDGAAADAEEVRRERRIPPRFLRQYKIQEVIKRRQIMLVQVVKEERGSKGAALTTYISLAGRFSVLMPNSPNGGGISRKITGSADRKRLREVIDELGLPQGMSLIVRTAGANRPKSEIKRDCEYLLRLWDSIRERTLQSTAPALIYEEADLIKRSIRDVYARDVEEIIVEGEDAYREARDFMRMLMPSHVRKIQLYRDPVPLFVRYGVEQQLEAMFSPVVQLKSGGYLVINQTEALVSIDVNSGRATRDRHIEDTALKVNLEAADEIARQLRLRDLAGLIVIDFIDMESSKHDAMVERRLKEALKNDRARIQVGRISHFGLLEMSRQRLRPSLTEHTFVTCPHCQGRGLVRSLESSALSVLRAIEEEGAKRRAAEILVRVAQPLALFLLNRRRDRLAAIEARYGMQVVFEPDDSLVPPALRIERIRPQTAPPAGANESAPVLRMDYAPPEREVEDAEAAAEETAAAATETPPAEATTEAATAGQGRGETPAQAQAGETEGEGTRRRRRRRRRRPGGRREEGGAPLAADQMGNGAAAAESGEEQEDYEEDEEESEALAGPVEADQEQPASTSADEEKAEEEARAAGAPRENGGRDEEAQNGGARRRRGRRGGRRRRPELEGEAMARSWTESERLAAEASEPQPSPAPVPSPRYAGPTPADPFAGHIDDIYEAMAAAEAAAEAAAAARALSPAAPASAPPADQAELSFGGSGGEAGEQAEPAAPPPPSYRTEEAVTAEEVVVPPPPAPEIPAVQESGEATSAEPAASDTASAAAPIAPPPAPEPAAAEAPAVAPAREEPRIGPPIQPRLIDLEPETEALPKRRGYWRR